MNLKLFYSTPKWLGFVPPEKPDKKNYPYVLWSYEIDMQNYEKAYAEAKANALEVGNPRLFLGDDRGNCLYIATKHYFIEPGKEYDWPGSAVIKDGKYYLSI